MPIVSYIHNWSLQSFIQDYDLASQLVIVGVVLYFYFLKSSFNGNFIYFLNFYQNFAERKSTKEYFRFDVWLGV